MPTLTENGFLVYYQAASASSTLQSGQWHINEQKRHAFAVYSDFDGLKEEQAKIIPETSESELRILNDFATLDPNPVAFRTEVSNEGTIELKLDDRVVSILLDQSGSMTWNDNGKLRHTIARSIVNRITDSYPGDVKYNVVEFGGKPIDVTLFSVVEANEILSDDIQEINSAFFEDTDSNFAGVRIVRKIGSFPSHPLDGEIVAEGFLSKTLSDELNEEEKNYYKVFTFDKNFHFSSGVEISATPRTNNIPRGVSKFDIDVLNGSGVTKDSQTIGVWHLDEGKETTAYDFSDKKLNLTVSPSPPVWLEADNAASGTSGLRFDGSSTLATSGSTDKLAINSNLTITAWIYPFKSSDTRAIVGRQNATAGNYLFYQSGEALGFFNGSASVTSSSVLTINEWNHVAVTANYVSGEVKFYHNGLLVTTATLGSLVTNSTDDMTIDIGFDRFASVAASRFFGRITEVAIHETIRNQSYINSLAVIEANTDNGDRLVLLKYDVPSDFNFSDIKIIRNEFAEPSWIEDGTEIFSTTASAGKFVETHSDDFVLGATYNYKLFTQNSIGNISLLADSANVAISIPALRAVNNVPELTQIAGEIHYNAIMPPVSLTARPGNKKIYLQWVNFINDSTLARVRIYYSDTDYPVVGDDNIDETGQASGLLVFEGNIDDQKFVHRDIENARPAFYTVVNIDRFSRVSSAINATEIPSSTVDEVGIPLLDVKNLTAEIANNNALNIIWDNPIELTADLEAFFGDRVLIYAAISDQFGQPISDETDISMTINPSIGKANESADVFGTAIPVFEDNDMFQFSIKRLGNGVIKGTLRMALESNFLSFIQQANFQIQVTSTIKDPKNSNKTLFEFISAPANINMKNPWKTALKNRDNRFVERNCSVSLKGLTFGGSGLVELKEKKRFQGAYVRSTLPFMARLEVSFRDEPIPAGNTVQLSVWDTNDDICSREFVAERRNESDSVLTPSLTLETQVGLEEELDGDGNPTGELKEISFVDIPLTAPQFPQGSILYTQASFGGFTATNDMFVLFETILNMELTARAPRADGIDVAEQQTLVYLIDPDDPADESKRTFPSDLSVVKWGLVKKDFAQNRPFYSSDNVNNITNGIFSFTRNGLAKNVFFGPASNVEWHYIVDKRTGEVEVIGERYEVRAKIITNGLSADDKKPIEIFPLTAQNDFGARLLMEMDRFQNLLWADGEDYVKLSISQDPNTSTTKYSNCFRQCAESFGEVLFPLNTGQFVNIIVDEQTEILWGDITETIDPYTGGKVLLLGENSFSSIGTALVEILDADKTEVFFRINDFFSPIDADDETSNPLAEFAKLLNPCECLGITTDNVREFPYEKVVTGSSTVFVNNVPERLTGGGALESGVPPTLLIPKEPLEAKIVDHKVDGVPSDTFVVDGKSVNEIVIEVSFAGKPVPNYTPLTVATVADSEGNLRKLSFDDTIYTRTFIDENIDALNERSYASLLIDPVSPEEEIFEEIIFTSTFDKSGDVAREINTCVQISWNPGDEETTETANIFSNRIDRYDIAADSWFSLTGMASARGHLNVETVGGKIYAIGGISTTVISKFNERYDPSLDKWEFKENMPTPRFGSMSVTVNGKIYVFGGINVDGTTFELAISQAVEVYDPENDDWEILSDMPTIDDDTVDGRPYGVAFGVAANLIIDEYSPERIYILSGLTEIKDNGNISKLNDRILTYDIVTDSWSASSLKTGVDLELYKRISPSAFSQGSSIIVFGGASQPDATSTDKAELLYVTDSFSYTPDTDVIAINDFDFGIPPRPRYRATIVSKGNNHYVLGGSNEDSQALDLFEKIDSSVSPFSLTTLADIPKGRSAFGSVIDSNSLYAVGGFFSGREDGFTAIRTEVINDRIRLDGKQSAAIKVTIEDEAGDAINRDIKLLVRGFVKFIETWTGITTQEVAEDVAEQQTDESQRQSAAVVDERIAIYPVLFTSTEVTATNGEAILTLLPRSDDLLDNLLEVAIDAGKLEADAPLISIFAGESRQPYQIAVQITIVDDTLYGQTVEDLTQAVGVDATIPSGGVSSTGKTGSTSALCQSSTILDISVAWTSFSRGISLDKVPILKNSLNSTTTDNGSTAFSLIPAVLAQGTNPFVAYFNDIPWIPFIDSLLDDNDGSSSEALEKISNLENSIPFGASALFDAIYQTAQIMQDNDLDGQRRVMYVFTDNESNMSIRSIDEAIGEVNAIDGVKGTPIITAIMSAVEPRTLSAKSNLSDINDLNQIAKETGGQNLTVLSSENTVDTISILTGEATGAMGYGLYEFIYDIGEPATITSITIFYNLFVNAGGSWTVSVSDDGFNFTLFDDIFKPNTQITLDEVRARFIKFTIILTTSFLSDEYFTNAPSSVTKIEVVLETEKVTYLFLNTQNPSDPAQQVVLTADTNNINPEQVKLGVAKSASHNWVDFFSPAQPAVDQSGKIFIPIRFTEDTDKFSREPLISLDKYTFRAKYGRWNPESTVIVYDSDKNIIDSTDYKIFARDGLIVSNSGQGEGLEIEISNSNDFRVGLQFSNRSASNPIEVSGLGYMYNTNISLSPPAEKIPPEARKVTLTPNEPSVFSIFEASYDFFDSNRDDEDTDKTEIRWFINNVRIDYLDDLKSWNDSTDLTDPLHTQIFTFDTSPFNTTVEIELEAREQDESIVKSGDTVYFTIRVSDGSLFGETTKSNIVTVVENAPLVNSITLKAIRTDGAFSNIIRGERELIVTFDLISDTDTNNSEIVWTVNDEEFKRGIFGVDENANKILPAELNEQNVLGLEINNEIFVTVIPQSAGRIHAPLFASTITGAAVTSDTVVVTNSIPIVSNVLVGPTNPISAQDLVLSFDFGDYDIDIVGTQIQENQSTVKWFFRNNANEDFIEVTEVQNQSTISSSLTQRGQQWFAEVTPFDTLDIGEVVASDVVTIR